MRRALVAAVFVGALVSAPLGARAGDVEQAKELFDQGVKDLLAEKYAQACPAIERSFRLDPRPGTLFTLAECEAKWGRTATAVARYTEYLGQYKQFAPKKAAEQKGRAEKSRAQIAALGPEVPLVTLRLPDGAPEDLEVRHDGELLPRVSLSAPIAVNPGVNTFTTQVPGGPLVPHKVTAAARDRLEITLTVRTTPDPEPAPTATASAPATAAIGPVASSAASAPLPSAVPDTRSYRFAAAITGGTGAVGIVAGVVTGILAVDQKATRDRLCRRSGEDYVCDTLAGVSAGEQLKVLGGVSTAAFVLGAAGLATSGVLLLAMPSSKPDPAAAKVRLTFTPVGFSISGAM